jgi:hypothetical protein
MDVATVRMSAIVRFWLLRCIAVTRFGTTTAEHEPIRISNTQSHKRRT